MPYRSLAIAFFLSFVCFSAHPGERPNVVLMMADDMGWGGVDFEVPMGVTAEGQVITYPGTQKWATPNLRAMAENGLVFGRMYSQAPTCSPTRASVLTGRAPQRMGIPFANQGRMENREVTLAEYAQSLGYRTGMFGKWHLGVMTRTVSDSNRGGKNNSHALYSTPLNSGFDVQYATEAKTSTGAIVMLNNAGEAIRRFEFEGAWPVSWEGPSLSSGGSALALESLEIAHNGLSIKEP